MWRNGLDLGAWNHDGTLAQDQPGKHGEIDVAAADDDADALAISRERAIEDGSRCQAAGRLDDHLHPFGEETHRSNEIR